ncbi:hypothetical protein M5K25_017414 [Dendrobium thyrsiflorum]|uniref:Uncharacterized protein n=1 Tax=Dendrobium thyrsiflorum TaxID=117978 RepID=A0ABD0UM89_DENTH
MVCLKTITAFLRSRLRHCLRSRSPDVSMNGPRDWSKIAPQSGTTFLLQQRSAPQDEKRQTLGVYGLKTDSWIDNSNSNFSKHIVELNVSEIRTQRHRIRLNPSPNEPKSKTRSTLGRGSISAVHSNHSKNTLDLSLIYWSCHSQKIINRPPHFSRGGRSQEKEEGRAKTKKRRRKEEPKQRREGTDHQFSPDFHQTTDFCPATY